MHCRETPCSEGLLHTGCASEEALLSWPALALRCGRLDAALAAAQRAAAAMPNSPRVQRQALVLQAQHCTMQVPAHSMP